MFQVQVKVISFGGLCDKDFILSTLDKAANNGHWLVFNNCHLLDQWDDEVLMHLNHLSSSFKGGRAIKNQCELDLYLSLTLTNNYDKNII